MFLRLWKKECIQTGKSIVFLIFAACALLFFFSQMGQMDYLPEPTEGEESYAAYGSAVSTEPENIMTSALSALTNEYVSGSFSTYPVGFVKNVKLNKTEMAEVEAVLEKMTGLSVEELKAKSEQYYSERSLITQAMEVKPAAGTDYEEFLKEMDQIDRLLGGGSEYSMKSLKKGVNVPMDYKAAQKSYENLIQKDRLTGGYARLFCDYMGIVLGLIPVFVAVTRGVRDRRSQMSELIYTRKASSAVVVLSRYAAMVTMMMAVVLVISCFPLAECVAYGNRNGIDVDYFAFVRYSFIWLLPEIMVVSAVGIFLTELTDSAAAVFVQAVWWFVSVFGSVSAMDGGDYGWGLVMRHNTEMNYAGYKSAAGQLLLNRTVYVSAALVLAVLTIWVYSEKRKGRFLIREKILGNRKRKSAA